MGGWGEAKAREAAVAARVQAKAGVAGESSRGSLQEGGGICMHIFNQAGNAGGGGGEQPGKPAGGRRDMHHISIRQAMQVAAGESSRESLQEGGGGCRRKIRPCRCGMQLCVMDAIELEKHT